MPLYTAATPAVTAVQADWNASTRGCVTLEATQATIAPQVASMPAANTEAAPTRILIQLTKASTIGVTTFVLIHATMAPTMPSMVVMAAVTLAVIVSQMDANTALIVSAAALMPSPMEDMTPLTVSAMDEKILDTALTAL